MLWQIPIIYKLFQRVKNEGKLSNAFFEPIISMILKPNKTVSERENYKPILLIILEYNFLIQKNTKKKGTHKEVYHNEVEFFPGM